jgi:hypothetical protein
MRTFRGLVAGVILSGLSLACSLPSRVVEAKSSGPVSAQASAAVPASVGSYPLHSKWRVGSPIRFEKLTIFPVISDEPTSTTDFITLDEGLRTGKVVITELGANGRSRRIRSRRVSDDAEVNKLAIRNNSGKTLVLIAGEMIVGGKQDRIVGHDCLITSNNTPVPLDVFCVEHGRWSGEAAFGQSRRSSGVGGGAGPGSGGGSGGGESFAMMAAPKVREKAQAKKSQSEVWAGVSEAVTVTATDSPTGDLKSVYRNNRVNNSIGAYQRAFNGKLSANNIVGIIAAVDGRIISADVFAGHSLFQAYWPKMLKSYALEAISTTKTSNGEVDRSAAESYLARVQGENTSAGEKGVYKLGENQSDTDASFELESIATKPMLIHFNRVSKR